MTTITISHPRELLALVPHQIGFVPEDSVVALSLRRPRGRLGLVARVDLDVLADPDDGPGVAHSLVGHLERDRAQSVVLVVYTAVDPRGTAHPAHRAVRQVRRAGEDIFGPMPAWAVTRDGYLSLDCAGECCPPGGRPLAELCSTAVGVRMIVAGSAVVDRRSDLAAVALAPGDERRAVARVRVRWAARGARAATEGAAALERWRTDSLQAWRDAVDLASDPRGAGRSSRLGRIEAGLRDGRVRDAVLASMADGTGDLPERLVRGVQTDPEDSRSLAAVLDRVFALGSVGSDAPAGSSSSSRGRADEGCEAASSSLRLSDACARVLESVVAHGRRDHQAPALTLLALAAWWAGEGARANLLLSRALRDDPDHRLALLLTSATAAGAAAVGLATRR